MFDWKMEYPDPLVPRQRRLELNERLNDEGEVVDPLDRDEVRERTRTLVEDHGVDSVAVSLLHSYESDEHEQIVADVIAEEYPDLNVSLSSEVVPVIREYERTSTTVINAYVAPVVADYLEFLQSELTSDGFAGEVYMMTSSGGIVDVQTAKAEPISLVESGPAARGARLANLRRDPRQRRRVLVRHGRNHGEGVDRRGRRREDEVQGRRRSRSPVQGGSGYDLVSPLIDLTEIGAGGARSPP